MTSKSVERFKQGALIRQTTDRQTTLRINVEEQAESLALQDATSPSNTLIHVCT